MVSQLQTLNQATNNLAAKFESEKNNHVGIEQINDVDARVQSLAEQVNTIQYRGV